MARTYLPPGVKVKRLRYPKGHPKAGEFKPGKRYIGDGSHAPNLTGGLRIGPSRKILQRRASDKARRLRRSRTRYSR